MNKYFDKIKSKYRYLTVFEKIISLNILVYVFTFFLKDIILDYFQLSSSVSFLLLNPWTILTYSFIHINIIDLIINMLILYYVSNSLGNIFDSKLPLKIFQYPTISFPQISKEINNLSVDNLNYINTSKKLIV